jgi:hypothetical protein
MTIRRYHWVTDNNRDQLHFLNSVAKVYKTYTKNDIPELINFTPQLPPSATGSGQLPLLCRLDVADKQDLPAHHLPHRIRLGQSVGMLDPCFHLLDDLWN